MGIGYKVITNRAIHGMRPLFKGPTVAYTAVRTQGLKAGGSIVPDNL